MATTTPVWSAEQTGFNSTISAGAEGNTPIDLATNGWDMVMGMVDIDAPHYCGRQAAWVAVYLDGSEVELCATHKYRARHSGAVEIKPIEVQRHE